MMFPLSNKISEITDQGAKPRAVVTLGPTSLQARSVTVSNEGPSQIDTAVTFTNRDNLLSYNSYDMKRQSVHQQPQQQWSSDAPPATGTRGTNAGVVEQLYRSLNNQSFGTLNRVKNNDISEVLRPSLKRTSAAAPKQDDAPHQEPHLHNSFRDTFASQGSPPPYSSTVADPLSVVVSSVEDRENLTGSQKFGRQMPCPSSKYDSVAIPPKAYENLHPGEQQNIRPQSLQISPQATVSRGNPRNSASGPAVVEPDPLPTAHHVDPNPRIPKPWSQRACLMSQAVHPLQALPETTNAAAVKGSVKKMQGSLDAAAKNASKTRNAPQRTSFENAKFSGATEPKVNLQSMASANVETRNDPDWNEVNSLLNSHVEKMKVTEKNPEPVTRVEVKERVYDRFMKEYGAQDDEDGIAEHLKEQLRKTHGATGTLDVEVCLDIIDKHDVTIVVTDTGTGKSSLIPKGLYERYPDAWIVNCQPRRTTTINLAQRVADLMGEKQLGKVVGYSVRGERAGELGETPLMYVTNFTLFLFLLWKRPEEIPFTHIILDEFHERASEVELLLVLLKLVVQRFPKKFKIVLCSATAQVEEWISFFDNMSVGEYTQANAMFPVYKYYMEDICELVDAKCPRMKVNSNNWVHSSQLHNILLVIKKTLSFLATVLDPHHSILVFLPGRTTVETFAKWIHSELNNELDPVMWYAGVDLACIQEAIERKSTTKKKVYLATDIAELGLTLPDAVITIDSGMCKRPLVSEQNPYSVVFPPLELLWESSLNARQRCGRVGRVQQGFYFSMLYRNHYDNLGLSDSRIKNSVLNSLVLLSLQLSNTPSIVFNLCHQQPRGISIEHSLDTLQDDGFIIPASHKLASKEVIRCIKRGERDAIASSGAWKKLITDIQAKAKQQEELKNSASLAVQGVRPGSVAGFSGRGLKPSQKPPGGLTSEYVSARFQVTLKGFFVSYLHTSIESASIAFYGVMFNIPMLCIIASVVESVKSPFNTPYNIYDKVEKLAACKKVSDYMRNFKGELNSDIVSCVGAVLSYMDMQRSGLSDEAQEQWCTERFLSRIRLTETVNVIRQMKEHVSTFFPLPEIDDIDELLDQYDRYAPLLNFICVGVHLQRAVYVHETNKSSKRLNQAGSGIFIKMNIEKNNVVPSICPWHPSSVCVPLSLRTSYEKLRAEFVTQVDPAVFNIATLIFAFRVVFQHSNAGSKQNHLKGPGGERSTDFLFQVIFMGVQQVFACDQMTGQLIIQLRRMMCARLRAMHIFLERQDDDGGQESMTSESPESETDFGIPATYIENPDSVSALLQQGLIKLLARFEHVKGNSITQSKAQGSAGADTVAFCSSVNHFIPHGTSMTESLLVHSCNGIFPVSG